jgi:branched-chain amino acid aminotransferase
MTKASRGKNTETFADGRWYAGSPNILGPHTHAVWLASVVFDGARAFSGVAPDLDRHCARLVASARILGLEPMLAASEIEAVAREGIGRFPAGAELYICPMFYAADGFVVPDPASTRFVLSIYESALPEPTGFTACLSSFRRPARDMAPTEAKASCLYPNVARVGREAQDKGFDTAIVRDPFTRRPPTGRFSTASRASASSDCSGPKALRWSSGQLIFMRFSRLTKSSPAETMPRCNPASASKTVP